MPEVRDCLLNLVLAAFPRTKDMSPSIAERTAWLKRGKKIPNARHPFRGVPLDHPMVRILSFVLSFILIVGW